MYVLLIHTPLWTAYGVNKKIQGQFLLHPIDIIELNWNIIQIWILVVITVFVLLYTLSNLKGTCNETTQLLMIGILIDNEEYNLKVSFDHDNILGEKLEFLTFCCILGEKLAFLTFCCTIWWTFCLSRSSFCCSRSVVPPTYWISVER